ncbi:bestrophin family protein [Pollutibacter soli]|uniref:bestrophin family protein n=1 Tax=Pollutibacter soli TaxID=3034157 RepID=UPI003013914A
MLLNRRIPLSYLVNKIKRDFVFLLLFNIFVISLKYFFHFDVDLPLAVVAFLGTAISLVLSFKLSQSYDRWWEARKIWGGIVNDSRTLVVQLKQFCTSKEAWPVVERMGMRQLGWNYSLARSLRRLDPRQSLQEFISEKEFATLANVRHLPLALLDHQSSDLQYLHQTNFVNDYQQVQLDTTLLRLCDHMGRAERIKNTIFPRTYNLFLRFFIIVFLVCLVVALEELNPFFEFGLMVTITLPFLLLQKTAWELQDPFENRPSDTPLTAICQTIETNIKQLLGMAIPEFETNDDNYYQL